MPTTGKRAPTVTPSVSLTVLTRRRLPGWSGFPGLRPALFPTAPTRPSGSDLDRVHIGVQLVQTGLELRHFPLHRLTHPAGPAASDAFGATVGLMDGSFGIPRRSFFPDPTQSPPRISASICRFHSRTVASWYAQFGCRLTRFQPSDAIATTASFQPSGDRTAPHPSWPGASSFDPRHEQFLVFDSRASAWCG